MFYLYVSFYLTNKFYAIHMKTAAVPAWQVASVWHLSALTQCRQQPDRSAEIYDDMNHHNIIKVHFSIRTCI